MPRACASGCPPPENERDAGVAKLPRTWAEELPPEKERACGAAKLRVCAEELPPENLGAAPPLYAGRAPPLYAGRAPLPAKPLR